MPSLQIVGLVLVVAFALFLVGRPRADVVALLVLLVLVLTGVVAPENAFAGFSSFAVMAIAGLLVIGDGLERTGVVKYVARRFESLTGRSEHRLLAINTAVPGILSGFVNIVAAASFFIPVVLRLCLKVRISPSRVLMPMAALALIGANLTLIGASHNLVVHSLLRETDGTGFGFFEFTAVGGTLLAAALIYLFTVGRHLLPDRIEMDEPKEATVAANLIEAYELEDRLFEVWITSEFPTEGARTIDLGLDSRFGLTMLEVIREGETLVDAAEAQLEEGDILLLQGNEEAVRNFCDASEGVDFMGPPRSQERYPISTAELAEAVVPPRSPAIGKTARDAGFREDYGLTVIAYHRDGTPHRTHARDEPFRTGDGLLFYGPRDQIRDFEPDRRVLVYHKPGHPEVSAHLKKKGPLAALILVLVVGAAAADLVPIAVSALAGAAVMVLAGISNPRQAYDAVDLRTLVLIGGLYPLGLALNETGAADQVGAGLVSLLGGFGPVAVMAGLVVLTMVLTQPMHNAAVAIIVTPIAIQAAAAMEVDPKAFCVAVLVACSTTFLMPYGHPAPLMVQEPGGYRSSDYVRFGLPLNLLAVVVILVIVPMLWPM